MKAFGLEDCQKQCIKKGTRVQFDCMKKAQSLEDLAKCRF